MKRNYLVPLLPILLFGCGDPLETDGEEQNQAALAIPSGTTLWNNGKVSVCWRYPGTPENDRGIVKRITTSGWPSVADIDFVAWDNCYPDADGTQHRQGRLGAWVFYTGDQSMSGCDIGSTGGWEGAIGQDFNIAPAAGAGGVLNAIGPTLVNHEIGHCLGFMHEHDRQDATAFCTTSANAAANTLGTAQNDTNSAMTATYCHNNLGLSNWDIVGVQRAYGPRRVNNNAALVYVNQATYLGFPSSSQNIYYFQNDSSGTRFSKWNGSSWAWTLLGQAGNTTTGLPSVTTFRNPSGTRYIHAFTRNSNNSLAVHWMTGSNWNKTGLPGTVLSNPSATSYTLDSGAMQVDVFYQTTSGNIGQTVYNGSQWLSYSRNLPVKMVGAPSVVSTPDAYGVRTYNVFYRGTDGRLRMQRYDGNSWTDAGAITSVATMSSDPEAYVSVLGDTNGTRRYDVFWVSSSGELHDTISSNGTGWTDYNLGNGIPFKQQKLSAAIAYDKDGVQRYWIAGLGASNNVVLQHWSGTSWTRYSFAAPSGVTLTDIPQIEAHETAAFDRRINIFTKAGAVLYSLAWDGASWSWKKIGQP